MNPHRIPITTCRDGLPSWLLFRCSVPIGAVPPTRVPRVEIVNSARAIAVGMHCAAMRASSIPEKITSATGTAACVYLPDYTIAQFVGEVSDLDCTLQSAVKLFHPHEASARFDSVVVAEARTWNRTVLHLCICA